MTIEVNNESGDDVDETALAALRRFVLDRMRVHPQAELSVAVDGPRWPQLHVQWMDEQGPTDVLASRWTSCGRAPADEEPEPTGLLGDVVLCPEVAARQAGTPALAPATSSTCSRRPRHPAPARLRPRRARQERGDVRAAGASCSRLARPAERTDRG